MSRLMSTRRASAVAATAHRSPAVPVEISECLSKCSAALVDVGSKDRTRSARGIAALVNHVEESNRKLQGDDYLEFAQLLRGGLCEMLASKNRQENLGGIAAILAVVRIKGCVLGTGVNIAAFSRSLRDSVLPPFGTDADVAIEATKAIGQLCAREMAPQMSLQFVMTHAEKALEWLEHSSDKDELKRHVATLMLDELVVARPNDFWKMIPRVFECIFKVIHDMRPDLRVAGVKVLRHCLMTWRGRRLYPGIYREIEAGFATAKEESVHGSLLAASEFVSHTGSYMSVVPAYFEALCDSILKLLRHKSPLVQVAVIRLVPVLALRQSEAFLEYRQGGNGPLFADITLKYIHICASKEKFRGSAFEAVGRLTEALKDRTLGLCCEVLPEIRSVLSKRPGKSQSEGLAAVACICIARVVEAIKSAWTEEMASILDLLYRLELTDELITTLSAIEANIPSLSAEVQRRTLDALAMVIQGHHYQHPGLNRPSTNPSTKGRRNLRTGTDDKPTRSSRSNAAPTNAENVALKVLSLRTLQTFNLNRHSLTKFCKEGIVPLMTHESADIREAACVTVAAILVPKPSSISMKRSPVVDVRIVSEVLLQLLAAGIIDRKSKIRRAVITSLEGPLEPYLAKVEALKSLFVFLYDDDPETRKLAVARVGRLGDLNPAYVMPALSRLLVQLLNDLSIYSGTRNESTSMEALIELVRHAPRVIGPYVHAVIEAVLEKLNDVNSDVFPLALIAMGELCKVDEACVEEQMPTLVNLILEVLQDQSSVARKEYAIRVLGLLAQQTGAVNKLYTEYPALMPTLTSLLNESSNRLLKLETLRIFGILGALDPHEEKLLRLGGKQSANASGKTDLTIAQQARSSPNQHPVGTEEYFLELVVRELVAIAYDASLVGIHDRVIRSVGILVLKTGVKFIPYLSQMVPALLHVVRTCDRTVRHMLFHELAKIVEIFGVHLRESVGGIVDVVIEFWMPRVDGRFHEATPRMHAQTLGLLRALISILGLEMTPHIPTILRHFMTILREDDIPDRTPTRQVLEALRSLAPLLGEWLPTAVQRTIDVVKDYADTPTDVRIVAAETLRIMAGEVNLGSQQSSLLHAVCRVIVYDDVLRSSVLPVLLALIRNMGKTFVQLGHKQMVDGVLATSCTPAQVADYTDLVRALEAGVGSAGVELPSTGFSARTLQLPDQINEHKQRAMHVGLLKLAKEASGAHGMYKLDSEDWVTQFNRLLFKESSSTALAACQELAAAHVPFARKLFKSAFLSYWVALDADGQIVLTEALDRAMQDNQAFMQLMLNVVEYLSHYPSIMPMPISDRQLGQMALECHTYAKALRYKELEFRQHFVINDMYIGKRPRVVAASSELLSLIEDMIKITQAVQQPEIAQGVMTFIRKHMEHISTDAGTSKVIQPSWYEKLGEWDKALFAYEIRLEGNPQDFELALGRMRCLDNLGKWKELHDLVEGAWHHATNEQRRAAAKMACSAAVGLGVWEALAQYLPAIPEDDADAMLYSAMLAIYQVDFERAGYFIEMARSLIEPIISSLWHESYSRGYDNLVQLQMLSELEEVMQYKLANDAEDEPQKLQIQRTWEKRLLGCQYHVDVWLSVLKVRSLVLRPEEDLKMWIQFCSLCRHQGEATGGSSLGLERAHQNLVMLLECDPIEQPQYALPTAHPSVTYAYIKFMWENSQKEEAVQHLYHLIDHLNMEPVSGEEPEHELLARCYHKLGQWRAQPFLESAGQMSSEITDEIINSIIELFHRATNHDSSWYKAWHAWAFMSFEAVEYYEQMDNPNQQLSHANMAITGFFNSIGLCQRSNLQDTLRLLTLWFKYGGHPEVSVTIETGVSMVSIDTWLQVIPQLIARIQIGDPKLRESIHDLLVKVGKHHAQALVFPLTVASQNSNDSRREAAEALLRKICDHSPELVDQALLVSRELIQVAILWSEMWFEGLDEASHLWRDRNFEAMFAVLEPLHQQLNEFNVESTARESEFVALYGEDLKAAWDRCNKYKRTGNRKDLETAWDHYHHVCGLICRALPVLLSLDLKDVSPKLHGARDLKLVVPGTYRKAVEPVTIQSISPRLIIVNSKQRPRRVTFRGSDGQKYQYLLKAHEDLRQDERVMQLFGLVNTLLSDDHTTAKQHLEIISYFVLPLSPNLGLIEWVPTCDTLHMLVREHRERNHIVLNQEVRLILQVTPDYDMLTVIQKIEAFRMALAKMAGDDIARVMWYQSGNSETWLERRTQYTRTLAVMSIVGYILGLGDRHPSNLMLDRISGSIMHVDFGDCFEVAQKRSKFPERVPFRLTRMLVLAMEVCGIDGTYRNTCENVMRVLRSNADSVIAVLEAFVHDPLIDWFKQGGAGRRRSPGGGDELTDEQFHFNSSVAFTESTSSIADTPVDDLNSRALDVLSRVKDKLAGRDFNKDERLDVSSQVSRLIADATSHRNLCQHYTGWCPFW